MEIEKLGKLGEELDRASGGQLSELERLCEARGLKSHLFVLTHLQGLAEGQMKLHVQAFEGDRTAIHFALDLVGELEVLGWNLYLHDLLDNAASRLRKAEHTLDALDEAQPIIDA